MLKLLRRRNLWGRHRSEASCVNLYGLRRYLRDKACQCRVKFQLDSSILLDILFPCSRSFLCLGNGTWVDICTQLPKRGYSIEVSSSLLVLVLEPLILLHSSGQVGMEDIH